MSWICSCESKIFLIFDKNHSMAWSAVNPNVNQLNGWFIIVCSVWKCSQWICASSCWHHLTFCWFISLLSACKNSNNMLLSMLVPMYVNIKPHKDVLLRSHTIKYAKGDLVTFLRLPVDLSALDIDNWNGFIHNIKFIVCSFLGRTLLGMHFQQFVCWCASFNFIGVAAFDIASATSCYFDSVLFFSSSSDP